MLPILVVAKVLQLVALVARVGVLAVQRAVLLAVPAAAHLGALEAKPRLLMALLIAADERSRS